MVKIQRNNDGSLMDADVVVRKQERDIIIKTSSDRNLKNKLLRMVKYDEVFSIGLTSKGMSTPPKRHQSRYHSYWRTNKVKRNFYQCGK